MCESPPDPRFPRNPEGPRLRGETERLAAALEAAGFAEAAEWASKAAAAVGEVDAPGDLRTDVEVEFDLDEHGRVWMYRDGDCTIIGRHKAVCAQMRRFLAEGELPASHFGLGGSSSG